MRVRLVSAMILLLTLATCGPPNNAAIKLAAKAKVQILNDATIQGDYAKVADLIHPNAVAFQGGRANLIASVEKSMKDMKRDGIEIRSSQVGEPSEIVSNGEELFIVVPFDLTMKCRDGMMISYGYVIGVSPDQGRKWTFVSTSIGEAIKKVLPNLPEALKLPEPKKPVIEKE
jgi:hypothetical protein